jgi:hypothetical protein
MQRNNNEHSQHSLFGFDGTLSASTLRRLETSRGAAFYREIFAQIPEKDFSVLYAAGRGAPSCAVNCLVGTIIL